MPGAQQVSCEQREGRAQHCVVAFSVYLERVLVDTLMLHSRDLGRESLTARLSWGPSPAHMFGKL